MIKSGTTSFADSGGLNMHKVAEGTIDITYSSYLSSQIPSEATEKMD